MKRRTMRAFSPAPHASLIDRAQPLGVPSINLPRAAMIVVLILVVAGGVAVRGALPGAGEPNIGAPTATAEPEMAVLPDADVPGADLHSMPRYPGAVRVAYHGSRDERLHRVAVRYLAATTVEEVRAFYQNVAAEDGWQLADVDYNDGAWSYVLVNGGMEALLVIEPSDGLVAVIIEIARRIAADPSTPPTVRPAGPPDDNDDDNDDDDDDGDDDDDSDGDD